MPVNVNLINNNRQGVESFAQGGIYKECMAITSANTTNPPPYPAYPIPVGTMLYIRPALWDENYVSNYDDGTDYVWEFEYTWAPGTYTCNLINLDTKYRNMICRIRVFTENVFIVFIEYLAVADMHNYLYPYTYQPLQLWQRQSVDNKKLNVYNTSNRVIGLRVSWDSNTWVQSDRYVQGAPWKQINYASTDNRYFYESNGVPVNGFIPGEDLKVNLRNFPRYTNSQYWFGVFRIDELAGLNLEFDNEIFMQMAKANNTADEPFEDATGRIVRTELKDAHGFRWDNFESIADFTIDADYFQEDGRYRIFVVTKESCQYRSYLFDEFGTHTPREIVSGTINVDAIDIDGTSVSLASGSCLYDVPSCAEMVITMEMDIASYEADLLAKGYPGSWADYFQPLLVECYVSDGMNQTGTNPFNQSVGYAEVGGMSQITYTFKIPESWEGDNKFINFVWPFLFPGGNLDKVVGFTSLQIHVSDPTDIEIKSPVTVPQEICDTDASAETYCFENPTVNHQFELDLQKDGDTITQELILSKEADFSTAADGCVEFDFPNAENEQEYCLKMRAHYQTTHAGPQPCDTIEVRFTRVANQEEVFVELCFEFATWLDADIEQVIISNNDKGEAMFSSSGLATDCTLFTETDPILDSPFNMGIYVRRTDGWTYNVEGIVFRSRTNDVITFDLCGGTTFQYCQENPILSHTIVWNYAAGGQLPNKTVTPSFTGAGVYVSDVRQYRQNNGAWVNYTVPLTVPPAWKIEFRWEITYTDCVIELYDCLTEEACAIP